MRFSWRDVAAVMILGWCVTPVPVGAQDPASGSGSSGASSGTGATQPAAPAKPKKIWTNDDVAAASGSNSPATKSKNDATSANDANAKLAKQLHDRLDKLEAQLRDTEKQLTDLKNFAAGEGNGTAGRQLHKGYSMEPVPDQIAKLETKRQQLQEQMNEVYDEARKKGVLPGQLR
jgi:hypothetical protein